MKPLMSSQQMAESDRYTIETLGVPGIELMELAARACVETLTPELRPGQLVAVITGAGNNGGDGFAIARLLLQSGFSVEVLMLCPPERLAYDALTSFQRLAQYSVPTRLVTGALEIGDEVIWLVDAIFGTGLNRPAEGRYAAAIEAMNQHPAPILAVDLPSGLSGNSCTIPGPRIQAQITVSFQTLKIAHALSPACLDCGQIVVPDIGIKCPPEIQINQFLLEASDYQRAPANPIPIKVPTVPSASSAGSPVWKAPPILPPSPP